jgi:hypothetical protein
LVATGGCGACGAFGIGKTSGAPLVTKPCGGCQTRDTRTAAQPFDPQMTATGVIAAAARATPRVDGATGDIAAADVENTAAGRMTTAARATSRGFCMDFLLALKTKHATLAPLQRAAMLNNR